MSPIPSTPMTVSVIVPAYNEQEGIVGVVQDLNKVLAGNAVAQFEILVVDDGSTDATAERLTSCPEVRVIRHARNRGYGAAIKTGIRQAQYEWICITDADGTYPTEKILDLLALATGAHMVVGARTGTNVEYPLLRRIPKAFLWRYTQWVTRAEIPDINSGLRIFRRDTAIRLLHLLPDGFSLTITITMAMLTNYQVVRYVPIGYAPRIGRSKIRPIRDTLNFLLLIIRTGVYFAPFRIFMPLAFGLFGLFLCSATYDILILQNLTDKTLILLTLSLNLGIFSLLADMIHKRSGG